MKSLALFIGLCVLISLVCSTELETSSFFVKDKPCESTCTACQQTVYSLKFTRKPGCEKDHCRNTCNKVWQQWTQPGSPFQAFNDDVEGKCEVCFRAGYCSMDECSVQKKFEVSVINSVIDSSNLKGTVKAPNFDALIKDVVKGKKINFKKVTQEVKKLSGRLIRHGRNSLIVRGFTKMLKAVKRSASTEQLLKLLKKAGRDMVTFSKQNKGISKKMQSLLRSFRGLAENLNVPKVRANKTTFPRKIKAFKRAYKAISKIFKNASKRFKLQVERLQAVKSSSSTASKNDKKVQEKLNKLQKYIFGVESLLQEAQKAAIALKKVFESVKL